MGRKLPDTITEEKFLEGVKKIKLKHIKASFYLGFYQCMRVSEIVNLTKDQIDFSSGFLHLKQAKGKKDRDIPIMKPVRGALRHIPIGIGVRQLQRQMRKYFPNNKFHDLRHSGATFYLNEKKIDIRYIQQLLGHARLDTTQIYTHVTPTNLKETFEEVW